MPYPPVRILAFFKTAVAQGFAHRRFRYASGIHFLPAYNTGEKFSHQRKLKNEGFKEFYNDVLEICENKYSGFSLVFTGHLCVHLIHCSTEKYPIESCVYRVKSHTKKTSSKMIRNNPPIYGIKRSYLI